jgi:hypothetical protein
MLFPNVSGKNLNGQQFNLPTDFVGQYNIVLVAFEQNDQYDVDTWVPAVRELVAEYPQVSYYELPVAGETNIVGRTMLDYWMRTGISDPVARAVTITLYIPRESFTQALNLTDAKRIYTLLVDDSGQVLWQTEGRYTEAKFHDLKTHLNVINEGTNTI